MKNRNAAYVLMRAAFGMVFLFFGITKFTRGLSTFATGMRQRFAGKLPMLIVVPFSRSLPFIEVLLGALILVGLFNSISLVFSGLLLILLTFGMVILGDTATVANNLIYVLINFILLYLSDHNLYSVGAIRRQRPSLGSSVQRMNH
jgi:thiosulfate dehydrogenase (quinone) large subunit